MRGWIQLCSLQGIKWRSLSVVQLVRNTERRVLLRWVAEWRWLIWMVECVRRWGNVCGELVECVKLAVSEMSWLSVCV